MSSSEDEDGYTTSVHELFPACIDWTKLQTPNPFDDGYDLVRKQVTYALQTNEQAQANFDAIYHLYKNSQGFRKSGGKVDDKLIRAAIALWQKTTTPNPFNDSNYALLEKQVIYALKNDKSARRNVDDLYWLYEHSNRYGADDVNTVLIDLFNRTYNKYTRAPGSPPDSPNVPGSRKQLAATQQSPASAASDDVASPASGNKEYSQLSLLSGEFPTESPASDEVDLSLLSDGGAGFETPPLTRSSKRPRTPGNSAQSPASKRRSLGLAFADLCM